MSRKLLFVVPLLALGIGGCDSGRQPIPITEKRSLSAKEQKVALGATSKQRFQMAGQMMGMPAEEDHSGHDHPPGEHGSHGRAENAPLVYQLPEGWKKEAATQFRTVNFSFGENGEGECYVSRVGGELEANLNRWRSQMGLDPSSPEDIQDLPKRSLFGMKSTYIELDGAFKGVGAAEAKPDYRMMGLVLFLPKLNVSFFVKMTGPKALLVENEKKFVEFCESLKLTKGDQYE